ncbi:MucBP domain-containing protein [Streptococcus equinus]|uniref:MucBP domain-containing protein n=1 Tax=Streptococcus equinus TaxID=1335 RepID=UPI000DF8AFF5|nr:MucBP domain-containing protein [Streptococcus equinus]SUO79375.1 putative muramidase-released protein [Streptococcus equinus]
MKKGKKFNWYSLRQTFSIRKYHFGAASVLLGTVFVLGNGGVVKAEEAVQSRAEATSALVSDNTVSKDENSSDAADVTAAEDTSVADTTEEAVQSRAEATSALVSDNTVSKDENSSDAADVTAAEDTSVADATDDSAAASVVVSANNTESSNVEVESKSEVAESATETKESSANEKTATESSQSANTSESTTESLEQPAKRVYDTSLSLSRTTIGYDGTKDGITITVNVTGQEGDIYTITIPKSSIYSLDTIPKLGNLGTTTLTQDSNNYYIKDTLSITTGFKQDIVLNETNNYRYQKAPMTDLGDIPRQITLSGQTKDGFNLGSTSESYTTSIKPSIHPAQTRYAPSSTSVDYVNVNTDYIYEVRVNEANGIQDDSYQSGKINAEVNYGSTITVPVPESFTLNEDATMAKNNFGDETTIKQSGGPGTNLIITVPKGSGDRVKDGKGYLIVGSYDREVPEEDKTVSAKGPIKIVQYLNDERSLEITGQTGPWTEKLRGKNSDKTTGVFGVGAANALVSSELLLNDDASDDPAFVNSFSYENSSILDLTDAVITLAIANGLDAAGVKLPSKTSDLASTTKYDYTLTYADGTTSKGTAAPGDTIRRTGSSAIRKVELHPDLIASTEKTTPAAASDLNVTKNQIEILGQLSKTYDDGSAVKRGDKLISTITIDSPQIINKEGKNVSVSDSTTQSIITEDDLKAILRGYKSQKDMTPGTTNAGYMSVYRKSDNQKTTDELKTPTFYYVLPRHTSYEEAQSEFVDSPEVSTYYIKDSEGYSRQVVKVDYSNQEGYRFNTDINASNKVSITNNNNALIGTYPTEIYATTATNMLNTAVTAVQGFDTAITQGITANTYLIWSDTWVIQQAAALYPSSMAQGNLDQGVFKNRGTSDDKGVVDMAFEFSIINALSPDAKNIQGYINIPRVERDSAFDFIMTGPVTTDFTGDYEVRYSTEFANMNAKSLSAITNTYVTADQITDWSEVRSIYVSSPKVGGMTSLGNFIISGKNPTVASDAGKTAGLEFIVKADDYDKPQLIRENQPSSPKVTITGKSTINTVLEYEAIDGTVTRIPLEFKKTYNDARDTMEQTDFPSTIEKFGDADQATINNLIAKGYDLSTDFPSTTIENGSVTWQDGEENKTAAFGEKVQYYFDDDTVVYRLRQVVAEITVPPTPGTSEVPDIDTGKDRPYPPGTPVPDGLKEESSYSVEQTAKRVVNYVFESNGDKPSVQEVTQTVTFKAPKKYYVNLVTGKLVDNPIVGDFLPVSGNTTDTIATMGADGVVTTTGAKALEANNATIPEVTGTFEGWYLVSTTEAAQRELQPGDDLTGELVYRRLQKADIVFVDEAKDGSKTELGTDEVSGKPTEAIDFDYAKKLKDYENQGYVLKDSDFTDGAENFDDDDTSDQHYKVVLVKVSIEAPDEISAGVEGQKQTETMTSTVSAQLPNLSTVSYAFEDGAQTKTVAGQGSYTIDATSGMIEFTPEADFVGTATPVTVVASATLTKSDGSTERISDTATYTPTVYGIEGIADTTSGKSGEAQTSITGAERFSDLNTSANTPNGTKPDWQKAFYSFDDNSHLRKIASEGTYTIDTTTGVVTFTPEDGFVGTASGLDVQVSVEALDEEGLSHKLMATGRYTPTVYAIQGSDDTSHGRKGEIQYSIAGAQRFSELNTTTNTPDGTNVNWATAAYTFEDGTTTQTVPGVGTYVIESTTGLVTYTPEADYVGTAEGVTIKATISAADAQGRVVSDITATGKYVPTVVDVRGEVVKDIPEDYPTYELPEVHIGQVIVRYTDESGTEIKSPVTDTEYSETGTPFDTTDHKQARITTEDGKTYELLPEQTKGSETGEVTEGTTEVTYIYREVKGSVIVEYKDTEGNVIKDPVTDTDNSSTGTSYETTDNKPTTITTETGKTYKLVPNLTEGEEKGIVEPGKKTVTYVYEEVKGSVIVNYVDEEGNVIKSPVTDTPETSTGTDYDTTDNKPSTIPTVDGGEYVLIEEKTEGTENGKVTEGKTEVTYVYREVVKDIPEDYPTYELPEVHIGQVIVRYTDESGTEIKSPVTDTEYSETGTPFDTTDHKQARITTEDGKTYELLPEQTKGSETGEVTEGTTEVVYVYREVVEDIPEDYPTYELPEVHIGQVIVRYTDESGTEIKSPVTDTEYSETGTPFDTTDHKQARITTEDGKTYELLPEQTKGSETGEVTEGTTEVVYVYREVVEDIPEDYPTYELPEVHIGQVIVRYTDESGTEIKSPVTDTEYSETGTPFDTTDHKPTRITTEDGKTYELLPEQTKGSETGEVTEGTTEVVYVYREVVEDIPEDYPTYELPEVHIGQVIVRYTDESGTEIKSPVTDTEYSETGTPFDTTDHKPTRITTEDGKTYELLPEQTKGSETGEVTEGTTEVVYVYREVVEDIPEDYPTYELPEVHIGQVIVRYTDESGTEIKSPVTDTEYSETGTPFDTTDHKPTRITTEDGKTYELLPEQTKGSETGEVTEGTTEVVYVYREVVEDIPEDYPTYELPELDIPETPKDPGQDVPNIPVTPEKPGDNIPVTPVIPEKPGHDISVEPQVPGNDIPTSSVVIENTPIETTPDLESDQEVDQLPNTGDSDGVAASIVGVGSLLAALGLAGKRRKKEDED